MNPYCPARVLAWRINQSENRTALEHPVPHYALVLAGGHYAPEPADDVWVWRKQWNDRDNAKGKIVTALNAEGRVGVEYASGGRYESRVQRVVKIERGPAIIISFDTNTYRRHCFAQPLPSDRCVEIGSSYGVATAIIARRCESIVGIDTSTTAVEAARKENPSLRFEVLDVLANPEKYRALASNCTMLFVDIGGCRELPTVVQLVDSSIQTFNPHVCVVKCELLWERLKAYMTSLGIYDATDRLPASEGTSAWWRALRVEADTSTMAATAKARQERRAARVAARSAAVDAKNSAESASK